MRKRIENVPGGVGVGDTCTENKKTKINKTSLCNFNLQANFKKCS